MILMEQRLQSLGLPSKILGGIIAASIGVNLLVSQIRDNEIVVTLPVTEDPGYTAGAAPCYNECDI